MAANDKLHRWLDLIAALLRRHYPVGFDELCREIPGYTDPAVKRESMKRMFERDKDELRDLGVAIETITDDEGDGLYRLRPADFYLPLLSVRGAHLPPGAEVRRIASRDSAARPGAAPRGAPRAGAIGELVLTPDDCLMLRRAAARVEGLANPELTADARSALRKLEFYIDAFAESLPASVPMHAEGDDFDVLGEALAHRKRVRFDYHAMHRDAVTTRSVEPYGLVFVAGHWYLIGRDGSAEALRQFRVSRIRAATMENTRKQHPDYEIPPDFTLSSHAASRQAWELGDVEATDVLVSFTARGTLVEQALSLGREVEGAPTVRRFAVRRLDAFLRWLLSFAGDAVPTAPAHVVAEWTALVARTRAQHARGTEVSA